MFLKYLPVPKNWQLLLLPLLLLFTISIKKQEFQSMTDLISNFGSTAY